MTYITKPKLHHPTLPTNSLGYTRRDYEGTISTHCAGCGHDSIRPTLVQRAGKAAMSAGELLRGYDMPAGSRVDG